MEPGLLVRDVDYRLRKNESYWLQLALHGNNAHLLREIPPTEPLRAHSCCLIRLYQNTTPSGLKISTQTAALCISSGSQ
jgi:hypothetical protein